MGILQCPVPKEIPLNFMGMACSWISVKLIFLDNNSCPCQNKAHTYSPRLLMLWSGLSPNAKCGFFYRILYHFVLLLNQSLSQGKVSFYLKVEGMFSSSSYGQ